MKNILFFVKRSSPPMASFISMLLTNKYNIRVCVADIISHSFKEELKKIECNINNQTKLETFIDFVSETEKKKLKRDFDRFRVFVEAINWADIIVLEIRGTSFIHDFVFRNREGKKIILIPSSGVRAGRGFSKKNRGILIKKYPEINYNEIPVSKIKKTIVMIVCGLFTFFFFEIGDTLFILFEKLILIGIKT